MVVFGDPKQKMVSSFKNFKTLTIVSFLVELAIGHPLGYSTATKRYFFSDKKNEKGPTKSIEKLSKSLIKRNRIIVLYFRMFSAFWKLWQLRTYSYTSDTSLDHQYLSTKNCQVDSKYQWPIWSWNIFSISTLNRHDTMTFGSRVVLLNNYVSQMKKLFRHFLAFLADSSSPTGDLPLCFLRTLIKENSKSAGPSSVVNTGSPSSSALSGTSACFNFRKKISAVKFRASGLYTVSNQCSARKFTHLSRRLWTNIFLKSILYRLVVYEQLNWLKRKRKTLNFFNRNITTSASLRHAD